MSFLDLYEGDQAQTAKIQPNEGTRLPSGFNENFNAAWSDGRMFGQSIARQNSRAAVLDDYLSEIKQKTGNDLTADRPEDIGASGPTTGITGTFAAANARVAKIKESYPDLDLAPLSDEEIDKRAVAKAQSAHRYYEELQGREKGAGGSLGTFAGSAAASATDPINILALAIAPETGGSVGILGSALRWGALAGASQAAIEASSSSFKDQVQPGYMESGQPFSEVAGAAFSGAVLGGSFKALGNAWTRVKTGAWPTSVRDAGNLIESEGHVASSNPFPGIEGEVAHREAMTKAYGDILSGNAVNIDHIITPEMLGRSRDLISKLETGQPMALPVINRRAIELVADQERLTARDSELATTLDKLPAGDASAADRLNRLQAVEQQITEATDPAAKRALNERRDQILVDTNPEALQAAAAPIEQRRLAEAERASIAQQLQGITEEHARLQSEYSLLGPLRLPALGERERIPTGPKGQFEMELQPPTEEPPKLTPQEAAAAPRPALQTTEQMAATLTEPAHQEAIRADVDRARAMGDVKVPGVDANGNHTMVGVDAAMDEVDAYRAAAEQIQACANPVQEAE
jgi:hypothetical protein